MGGQDSRSRSRDRRGARRHDRSGSAETRRWSPRGAQEERGRAGPWARPGARSSSRDDGPAAEKRPAQPQPAALSSSRSGSGSGSQTDQDEIVHFDWKPGLLLSGRYTLQKLLGDGTFGRVVLANDATNGAPVAIKVIRDVDRYMENAKIEADILKDIRRADPHGRSGCAIMFDTFTHDTKYFCLVFEPLGVSLYDFLKANHFRGFWMQDLQSFAKQCMQALSFLHEALRLSHTDLKPENILLQSMAPAQPAVFPRAADWLRRQRTSSTPWQEPGPYMRPVCNRIKLIDFGNATYEDEHHSSIINTRQYRGPEVLLESGWDERSDLWSVGCILMELYTGEQLFETHEELEHLALIARIIGELPDSMLARASPEVRSRHLVQDPRTGRLRLPWPERASSASSERHVYSQAKLEDQAPSHHSAFVRFVGKLLRLEPSRRPSATRALQHDFFGQRFED